MNHNDGLLSLLGLARRAGKLAMGFDCVCDSVLGRKSSIVLAAEDTSEGTVRKLRNKIGDEFAEFYTIPYDISRMDAALGKSVRLVSVEDKGFANKIRELLEQSGARSVQGEEKR